MKIIHISDLHIGLKLINRDLLEDQREILAQFIEKAKEKQPDVVVIAGDIYDKAIPSAEAVSVFDEFVEKIIKALPATKLMFISGNHDSAQRIDCFRNVLQRQNIYMIGNPPKFENEHIAKVVLEDEFGKVNFYLLPFVKPSMVKEIIGKDENDRNFSYDETIKRLLERENIDQNQRNIFVSHQFYLPIGKSTEDVERMDSEICSVGNIDEVSAKYLEIFDYAALGHIHKPMKVGSEFFRYCGTPFPYSVSEAGQEKGAIFVEIKDKKSDNRNDYITTEVIPLESKRKVRKIKGELLEILKYPSEDYVSITLTDEDILNLTDAQDRLKTAFPNLLEIIRENIRHANYNIQQKKIKKDNPYELCLEFLGDKADEKEKEIIQEIINSIQGEI